MTAGEILDQRLLEILRCPVSGLPLRLDDTALISSDGTRRYAIIAGIPCMIPEEAQATHTGYTGLLEENQRHINRASGLDDDSVNEFIEKMIVPTCGNLFHGVRFSGAYPIPDFPEYRAGTTLLDLGCNWGRWTIAGAKAGYKMIGVDIHLRALLCARRLSRRLVPKNEPLFVLADARYLPFASASFDGIFSYSVVQHFSKSNAAHILGEFERVMTSGAKSLVQMPNKTGLRALLTLGSKRNSEGSEFDVRYYAIKELVEMFEGIIGESDWFVDCFLGLNVHNRDRKFIPSSKKWIIDLAELLLRISRKVPILGRLSDSIFIRSTKA